MRTHTLLFRLTSMLAIGGLLVLPAGAPPAWAQQASAAPASDPPARVGRLAQINGTVSFHTADETEWEQATLNYPVTSGNSFWTEPASSAGIEVAGTRIVLGQSTEFDIDTLDDHTLAASEPQGTVYLGARFMQPGDSYQVQTPRGTVTITQAGRYGISAGDTDNPTTVIVKEGTAQVEGPGMSVTIGPHQTATITGAEAFQATLEPEQPDAQMAWLPGPESAPAAAADAGVAAPPPAVAQMTGGEDLARVGTWASTPDYGNVWYPPVDRGWVPYRNGHWAYVAPWGWTWIDDAPWGFAPFHYGRWVDVDDRWGWVPVAPDYYAEPVEYAPVYAPALVSFVGIGFGVGVGFGWGGGSACWVPLGPREPFFPYYHASERYFRNINVRNVTNITNITRITNNRITINNFANARGATVVPAAAMARSQPIARVARPVDPGQLRTARTVTGAPVRPTAATAGVTPAVARQLNIPRQASARPAAPGPAVQPRPGVLATAAVRPGLPTLRAHTGALASAPATAPSPRLSGAPGPAIAPRALAGNRPGLPALQPGAPVAGQASREPLRAVQPPHPGGAPGPAITPRALAGAHFGLPALRSGAPGVSSASAGPPPSLQPGRPGGASGPAIAPHTPAATAGARPGLPPPNMASASAGAFRPSPPGGAPGPAAIHRPGSPGFGTAALPQSRLVPPAAARPAPAAPRQMASPVAQHAPPPHFAAPPPAQHFAAPPAPRPMAPQFAQHAPPPAPRPAPPPRPAALQFAQHAPASAPRPAPPPAPAPHPATAAKQCSPGKRC